MRNNISRVTLHSLVVMTCLTNVVKPTHISPLFMNVRTATRLQHPHIA